MKHECPYCGADVSNINALVTYTATLVEENGRVIVDKPEEVIEEVEYKNTNKYVCRTCGHSFNKLKKRG